jgi:hypothetical protein
MHAKFEGENLKIERAVSILVKWVFIMWSNLKFAVLLFNLFHERANVGISALVFPLFWGLLHYFSRKLIPDFGYN